MFLPSIKSMKIPDLKLQVIDVSKNICCLQIQINYSKRMRTFVFDISCTIAYFCTRWMS